MQRVVSVRVVRSVQWMLCLVLCSACGVSARDVELAPSEPSAAGGAASPAERRCTLGKSRLDFCVLHELSEGR